MTAIDAISPAFEHMRTQLFRPFRRDQWLRLGLLGLVTGELSSGGGCNVNFPANWSSSTSDSDKLLSAALPHLPGALAIALLVFAALVLMLVMTYVSSVCRFILFETVLTRRCALREGWRRWQEQGVRFFGFNLLLMLAFVVAAGLLIGLPVAMAAASGFIRHRAEHMALFALGVAAVVVVALLLVLLMAVLYILAKDFVVPQMALENTPIALAWRRLLARIGAETGGFAGYLGMKIVLALAAAIMLGIAALVIILPVVLVGVMAGFVLVLAGKAMGLAWAGWVVVLAVAVGIVVALALVYAIGVLGSPITVFFPAYSMYFFAGRYPPLAERLFPRPPEPSPPPPAPPAPPEVAPAV